LWGQISQGSQSLALGLTLSPLRGWLSVEQISQGSQRLALGLALSPLRGSWMRDVPTQGSQSLALGLTLTAASQFLELITSVFWL
jgi:hypothetical protein